MRHRRTTVLRAVRLGIGALALPALGVPVLLAAPANVAVAERAVVSSLTIVDQDIELAPDDILDLVVQLPVGFDATTLGTDGSATDVRIAAYSAVSPDALGSARRAVREARQSARPDGRVEDFLDISLDPADGAIGFERLSPEQLRISIPTESALSTPSALQLPIEGVYPIVVDLRIDSVVRAEVITFVHRRAGGDQPVSTLAVAILVGQTTEPTVAADGTAVLGEAEHAELVQLADTLAALDAAPVAAGEAEGTTTPRAVRVEPATLLALQAADPDLFARLLPMLQRSVLISMPRLPLDLSGTVTAGRSDVYTTWLREGEDAVSALTGVPPDRSLLFADGELSDAGMDLARDLNARAVVMPTELYESTEGEIGDYANIDQLQTIELTDGSTVPAIRLDPELSTRLASISTPTLQDAVDMVAEILAFREDVEARGSAISRGGLLLARPDGGVIDAVLAGEIARLLVETEGVRLVAPSELPVIMDDQLVDGTPKPLTLATATGSDPTARFDAVDQVGAEAFAMVDLLPDAHPAIGAWSTILGALPSTSVTDAAATAMIASMRTQFAAYRSGVHGPDPFTFTLTGRTSDITVRVTNTTDTDLTVRLHFSASKLVFPDGDPIVTIGAQSFQDVTIRVRTRSNGTSQVILRIFTPNTDTQLGDDVILTAQVRALSGLGQLVTGAGLLVLLTWWVRHWRIARRKRRTDAVSSRHPANGTPRDPDAPADAPADANADVPADASSGADPAAASGAVPDTVPVPGEQ